jgi:hypothetical protein
MTAYRRRVLLTVACIFVVCVGGVGMYTSPDVNERTAWGAATILALTGLCSLTLDNRGPVVK